MAKEIRLAHGKGIAIVDEADYEAVSAHHWWLRGGRCACARFGKRRILMHQWIMKAEGGEFVDHINGDPLDNRRSNLRFCTLTQNQQNRKIGKDNKSGRKGVYWSKPRGLWVATIRVNGIAKNLGGFENLDDAAIAYDHAAFFFFGDFARTNFPRMYIPHE